MAAALDAVARRIGPFRYGAFTLLGLAMLLFTGASSVALAVMGQDPTESVANPTFAAMQLVWAGFLVPFTRYRIVAWIYRFSSPAVYAPFHLDAFSRRTLKTRADYGVGAHDLSGFPIRIETARLFVFARAEGVLGPVIPKRAFTDSGELEAFRRAFVAEPAAAEVFAAVRALGDEAAPDGIDYLLRPSEHIRGTRLLLGRSAVRFVRLAAVLVFVGVLVYQARDLGGTLGSTFVGTFVVIFAGALAFTRWRVRENLKKAIAPARLELAADGLRIVSRAGSFDARWSELAGYVEDRQVLVVAPRPGFGFILPKRSVPESALATIRANLAVLGR